MERLSASAANDRLHPPDTSLGVLAAPAAGRLPPDRPLPPPCSIPSRGCLELRERRRAALEVLGLEAPEVTDFIFHAKGRN